MKTLFTVINFIKKVFKIENNVHRINVTNERFGKEISHQTKFKDHTIPSIFK